MSTDVRGETNTVEQNTGFYDAAYYQGHYGALLNDPLHYSLLSLYWREILFVRHGLNVSGKTLDFGCGLGQVSAALPDTVCFDFNDFSLGFLRRQGRTVIDRRADIPLHTYDYLLSSHSLEHSPTPFSDLQEFRSYMKPGGTLVLLLPIETDFRPTLLPDDNQHLQAWTFQTITNVLLATGWKPVVQSIEYGLWMLRTLGRRYAADTAVRWAVRLGRMKKGFASLLTIATTG